MNDNYTEPELKQIDKAQRNRGVWYIAVAVAMALMTAGVYLALVRADDAVSTAKDLAEQATERDEKIDNLGIALEAQRQQFKDCVDKKPGAEGCVIPVAPPASSIGPPGPPGSAGLPGLQGLQGVRGLTGPTGPQGLRGVQGLPGDKGDAGDTGTEGTSGSQGTKGDTGADGKSGEAGPQGQQGERGLQGETGPEGPVGPTGPQGDQGSSAPAITGILFGSDPANCILIFQFSDSTQYTVAAPPNFCAGP